MSFDVKNESAVRSALSRLIKYKTVIMITHRVRTISSTVIIVMLRDSKAAEHGAPLSRSSAAAN